MDEESPEVQPENTNPESPEKPRTETAFLHRPSSLKGIDASPTENQKTLRRCVSFKEPMDYDQLPKCTLTRKAKLESPKLSQDMSPSKPKVSDILNRLQVLQQAHKKSVLEQRLQQERISNDENDSPPNCTLLQRALAQATREPAVHTVPREPGKTTFCGAQTNTTQDDVTITLPL